MPYYFYAFCVGNLLGPLTIGRLFDTLGRKKMIAGTYILSGVLLIITAQMFKDGNLNATTQTLCWAVIFFFASAGASAGYLTASEVFHSRCGPRPSRCSSPSPRASARSGPTCTAT